MGISVFFHIGDSAKWFAPALPRWINLRFLMMSMFGGRIEKVTRIVAFLQLSIQMLGLCLGVK